MFPSEDAQDGLLTKKSLTKGMYKDIDHYTTLPVIYNVDFSADGEFAESGNQCRLAGSN